MIQHFTQLFILRDGSFAATLPNLCFLIATFNKPKPWKVPAITRAGVQTQRERNILWASIHCNFIDSCQTFCNETSFGDNMHPTCGLNYLVSYMVNGIHPKLH